MSKKVLLISPHFSTGGAPQWSVKKVELIRKHTIVKVVEYSFVAWCFIVQRNRMINLVGESNFHSLGENKQQELLGIIESFSPDVILMEEFPEFFMTGEIADFIYRKNRSYEIIETTHDSSFDTKNKRYFPDKFTFVSAFSAIKYSIWDIPMKVIEYPVDKRQQGVELHNLPSGYKHIVIVGLFTPRKNQAYAFELAKILAGWKVLFHFIGNMADNFQDYWKPLVELKNELPNCIIWGEKDNVDEFYREADMFLFPSRGDRHNKELNPLVILEALEYENLHKLFFNLDVYLGKYDRAKNTKFLSGSAQEDAELILEILKPEKEEEHSNLIILGTYPNTKKREQLTIDAINSYKAVGLKVMLVSHYPCCKEIQSLVDYYIFDSHNPQVAHSYYTLFYNKTDDYDVDININGLKHSNQSLSVLTNMVNGFKAAKGFGFKNVFYSTYDVVLDSRDISTIQSAFRNLDNLDKAYLGTLNTPFDKGIQTNGMCFNIDYFLSLVTHSRSEAGYNDECKRLKCENFLEDYFAKLFMGRDDVAIVNNQAETLLVHSGLGVSSNCEYYSILPVVEDCPTAYMFYFYSYNIDDRKCVLTIDNEVINFPAKNPYSHPINFKGEQINIQLDFFDEGVLYKSEKFVMNADNIGKYSHTGSYRIKNRAPKIKLVHLQTNLKTEAEVKSYDSLSYGLGDIEYVRHINKPTLFFPKDIRECERPTAISDRLFTDEEVEKYSTALTPAHFGCFDAFRRGIEYEFTDDLDYLIVCEGDCILEVSPEQFVQKVKEVCSILKGTNVGYFSFGDTKTLDFGWKQSNEIGNIKNQDILFITDKIIGLQCVMFTKPAREYLKKALAENKWDAADMFFNDIFTNSDYSMAILKKRITTQADGFSLIDKVDKVFK